VLHFSSTRLRRASIERAAPAKAIARSAAYSGDNRAYAVLHFSSTRLRRASIERAISRPALERGSARPLGGVPPGLGRSRGLRHTAAVAGPTLCCISHPHGFAVRLLSGRLEGDGAGLSPGVLHLTTDTERHGQFRGVSGKTREIVRIIADL
jgi:hypothetical protein